MREKFIKLINKEMNNAKEGRIAYIILKMNNLVDMEMIKKLYKASEAGVQVKLCVRGTCALIPGIKGMSENIRVISIVDKFLEHSRIFVFANGGDEKYFISSGDWMYRNLDHRSEVAAPVFDKEIQQQLKEYLLLQFEDNMKARIVNEKLDNMHVQRPNGKTYRAQDDIYRWLLSEKSDKRNRYEGVSIIQGGANPTIILN